MELFSGMHHKYVNKKKRCFIKTAAVKMLGLNLRDRAKSYKSNTTKKSLQSFTTKASIDETLILRKKFVCITNLALSSQIWQS